MKLKNEENKDLVVTEGEVVEKATKKVTQKKEASLEEKIESWKAQFGRIYQSIVGDERIIWRAVKRSEYRELLRISDDLEDGLLAKQEATVSMVTLYPANISDLIEQKAGLATVLSEEILAKSGFEISETQAL